MRVAILGIALALGIALPVHAKTRRPFKKGTAVVIVGEISSQPRDIRFAHEEKMQVAVGPDKVDHTLHLDGARLYDVDGREIAISDLQDKWWVRAEGTLMKDMRRVQVTRLGVIARDWEGFRKSAAWKNGWERGYVETVAGSRQVYPTTRSFPPGTKVVLVGQVSSQPRNAGVAHEEKMQVAVGEARTDFTLHLDGATLRGLRGEEIGVSDLRDKMWVRAEGTVMDDSRRVQVERLELIGGEHPFWGFFYAPAFRGMDDPGDASQVPHR